LSKPDLDWSFDYIPAEQEGDAAPVKLPEAAALRARRRWRVPRWLAVTLLALAAGTALGAYVFQRVGWQRLEAQVAHEVVSEDAYARAGDVTLVRSFLAGDDASWAALRATEARHRLAVTLPAGHMRPLDAAPRVEAVAVLPNQLFEASVLRAFTDPTGQVYHFRYRQRYRNLGPGLWERLPTDPAALALQGRWTGQFLVAVFPMDDWPWMETALPRLDAWLVQACADWECPNHARVTLTFSGQPADLRPLRGQSTEPVTGPPTMPIVFALNQQRPLFPARLVLPALLVAGTPVEPEASEALLRALAVQSLLHLAQQVAGLSQDGADFYLEALVARAETRLGISPALAYMPVPDAYVPPPGLWSRGLGGRAVDLPSDPTYRLQALAFLNYALADAPAAADGALLRGLRRQAGLVPWLEAALGPAAARLPAAWTTRVTTASAPGMPLAWQRLNGLTYTCEDGAWLIRGRALEPLWTDSDAQSATASRLSPEGGYMATLRFSSVNAMGRLRVLAVDTGQAQTVAEARYVALLGWSADNALLYLQNDVNTASLRGVRLMRYDPAAGLSRMVVPNAVRPFGVLTNGTNEANWSPDRAALVLTLNVAADGAPARWAAALVRVAGTGAAADQVVPLGAESAVPILAPDAVEAVYERQLAGGPQLVAHNLATGARRRLVTAADLERAVVEGHFMPERLVPVEWSPDGEELLFLASGTDYGSHLYRVGRDGQGLRHVAGAGQGGWVSPLGFSADGRYLGYFEASLSDPAVRLQVLDTATGQDQDLAVYPGSVSWSAEGHLLALAVEDGAYVLDPATGERRWLAFQTCQRVSW
jgi:hypothetical protein